MSVYTNVWGGGEKEKKKQRGRGRPVKGKRKGKAWTDAAGDCLPHRPVNAAFTNSTAFARVIFFTNELVCMFVK